METPYEHLLRFIEENGLSRPEAETAVRNCARAMAVRGYLVGVSAGLVRGWFLAANPAAALTLATAGVVGGAGHALATAPACADVRLALRTAIRRWNLAG